MENNEYPDIEDHVPTIPKEIIDYLERSIPPRDYNSTDELQEIMHYSGKRAVVLLLKSISERRY